MLYAWPSSIEEPGERRLLIQRCDELDDRGAGRLRWRQHGLADLMFGVVLAQDQAQPEHRGIEVNGRWQIRYGDPDMVDRPQDHSRLGVAETHASRVPDWWATARPEEAGRSQGFRR